MQTLLKLHQTIITTIILLSFVLIYEYRLTNHPFMETFYDVLIVSSSHLGLIPDYSKEQDGCGRQDRRLCSPEESWSSRECT